MYWYKEFGVAEVKEGEECRIFEQAFIMRDGILRQLGGNSGTQENTKEAFAHIWSLEKLYDSPQWHALSRHMVGYFDDYHGYIENHCRVLECGTGSGLSASSFLGERLNSLHYLGIDVSSAIDNAAKRFRKNGWLGEFIQADLTRLPFADETFDFAFSLGVLHHTDSTERAIKNVARLVRKGGCFAFYVPTRFPPVRTFSDKYVRDLFITRGNEEVWEALKPLSKLGIALGKLDATIDIPEPIPYLGIPAGKMSIHRLVSYYLLKAFYHPDFDLELTNYVNFDNFKPANINFQSEEEVYKWCQESNLKIEFSKVVNFGINIIGRKIGSAK